MYVCMHMFVCVCVFVVTIGRILKTSNRETFLQLCEIMAVPKVVSGSENWNLMKTTETF